MEEPVGYRYNPCYIPQPHFVTGYGGYIPHMLDSLGRSYGQTTHIIARQDPLLAHRLAPQGVEKTREYWRDVPLDVSKVLQRRYHKNMDKELLPVCCCCQGCALAGECIRDDVSKNDIPICVPLDQQSEEMFIPEHIFPGYTGHLSMGKQGVPSNQGVSMMLKDCGREQKPWPNVVPAGPSFEDPFPGPPTNQTRSLCRDEHGLWLRYPQSSVIDSFNHEEAKAFKLLKGSDTNKRFHRKRNDFVLN